ENAALSPRPGGYWSTADGNLNAVPEGGVLLLSTGAYRPLPLYKRPEPYAWLALLAALAAPATYYYERRRKREGIFPSDAVLAAASAGVALLLLCVFVWLFSPAACRRHLDWGFLSISSGFDGAA